MAYLRCYTKMSYDISKMCTCRSIHTIFPQFHIRNTSMYWAIKKSNNYKTITNLVLCFCIIFWNTGFIYLSRKHRTSQSRCSLHYCRRINCGKKEGLSITLIFYSPNRRARWLCTQIQRVGILSSLSAQFMLWFSHWCLHYSLGNKCSQAPWSVKDMEKNRKQSVLWIPEPYGTSDSNLSLFVHCSKRTKSLW